MTSRHLKHKSNAKHIIDMAARQEPESMVDAAEAEAQEWLPRGILRLTYVLWPVIVGSDIEAWNSNLLDLAMA